MKLDSTTLAALIAGGVALIVALITAWATRRGARRDLEEAIAATGLLKDLEGHHLSEALTKRRDALLRRWSRYGRGTLIRWVALVLLCVTFFVSFGVWKVGEGVLPESVDVASQWIANISAVCFLTLAAAVLIYDTVNERRAKSNRP